MRLTLDTFPALQQDLLLAARLKGPLRRTRGGFAAGPGAKPFTTRAVFALQRAGLITLSADGKDASLTLAGNAIVLTGEAEVAEDQAG